MNWNQLNNVDQLEEIKNLSKDQKVLIFKHSTRCSVSSTALNRLERNWKEEDNSTIAPFILDLIAYRNISNQIAQDFGIDHESPQVLLIENGICVYNESHFGIDYQEIISKAAKTV